MNCPFTTEIVKIERGPNTWDYLTVKIYENIDGKKTEIGQYQRNLPGFYNTFYPFVKNGLWYALYSRDYTATRVMSLPSCKDLGGEEPDSGGFCPVDFYVPYEIENVINAGEAGKFGFVAGCIWEMIQAGKYNISTYRK